MAPDGSGPSDLARALGALYARVPLGMRLGLDAMRASCIRAGSPETAFPIVHIAGTNGKGSTSAMIASIAQATGRRVGLYTSPHLCRFAERIRIDGAPIADAELTSVLARALTLGHDLSFFETATLAALLAFRDRAVEVAVVEVGIGGRCDATNIVPPPVCAAITRVAFDHVDRLGDSLEAIAREKAGIAKAGSPMVLGPMQPSVREAAVQIARAAGARPILMDDEPEIAIPALSCGLGATYQVDNARVAWRIAAELGWDETARIHGLAAARWPGRFERISIEHGPLAGPWILDGAHNPDGARGLSSSLLSAEVPAAMIFGALADKAWPEMLDILGAISCPRFYVAPQGRAAADPRALAARAPGTVASSLENALSQARRAAGYGTVVLCGSLYLVGEARARLLGLASDPPVAL